ncbi:MAG: hypothetical protein K9L64_03225 [Candidatus Izimaplasma sp.]|nr:hypothetical protein [Candidatus Izimaplasma bacterium]
MKRYLNYFLKTLFIINLIYIILSFIIFRRFNISLLYFRLEIGAIIISIILSLAYYIFKTDKGIGILNVILAYVLIIPSLYIFRFNFGRYLFRSAWLIYIIFIIIGIIYGIVLYVVSKKYKSEVKHLNELLEKNKENHKKSS